MASEEDAEIDEIDEELARVERQIQELEERAGEVPEPEAPDPEAERPEAPAPEEAFEGDPDVDLEPTRLDRLKAKLRQLRERKADEEADEDTEDEAEEASDDEGGGLAFWRSSDDEATEDASEDDPEGPEEDADEETLAEGDAETAEADEEADDAPDEAEEASDDEGGGLAFWRSSEDEATEDASEDELDEPSETADADDEGLLAGVVPEIGSDDEPPAVGDATPRTVRAAADGPGKQPPTPPADDAGTTAEPAMADESDGSTRASALLARFQSGGDGDPDPAAAEDDEEDDDRGGLIVGALVVLLLLAGLAAAAYAFLPGGSGEELSANLVADAITNDEGRYIATTGEPLQLDASGSQGTVERYVWSFGDGSQETTTSSTVEHTYAERGPHTVEVTLESADGEATAQLDVLVVEAPQADPAVLLDGQPAAQPATIGNNVFVGDQVTLDGSASSADPEHTIRSYTWDVDGDGEVDATGQEAQLGFEGVGAWAVNLTVKDDLGNEDQATRIVHVSDRRVVEDTIGPSTTEAATANYTVAVEEARLQARPVQLAVNLTYSAAGNDSGLPVQPEVDPDLDLNVTDPEGNVFQADEDDGEGQEVLTLPAEELTNLGDWTVTVRQDNQNAGTASEAEYELVVETIY